ncbi:uncharacterized protein At1g66480-like [Benincasa hispida]|uniref:uncharacterized protein At1g66480-like n=1 Tax=Benincasa hispida TaxID=102211 RepID=UPI0018FF9117|nr:uncharacterized protein At1g66480-like [Benincasa hispida]
MGNSMGIRGSIRRRKRTTKVMKINGEAFKITLPTTAYEVTIHHPNHLLYESQSLEQFGLRAKPLDPHHQLKPKTLYFLLQLPTLLGDHCPLRRVCSDLHLSASDRLECLLLSRRSVSDLQTVRFDPQRLSTDGGAAKPVQVKFRLPRVEFERLMKECKNKVEATERIVDFCGRSRDNGDGGQDDELFGKMGDACSGKAREVCFLAVLFESFNFMIKLL